MSPTILRNADASIRGFIYYLGDHRTEIRDSGGQTLGWYNPTSNITYYINGSMLGFGNLLASLV
ncbi:MAG: hypothetical protein QNK36_21020 [Colwellia sp.]|nr:hypothetical protein [Colwellia sp.]